MPPGPTPPLAAVGGQELTVSRTFIGREAVVVIGSREYTHPDTVFVSDDPACGMALCVVEVPLADLPADAIELRVAIRDRE